MMPTNNNRILCTYKYYSYIGRLLNLNNKYSNIKKKHDNI